MWSGVSVAMGPLSSPEHWDAEVTVFSTLIGREHLIDGSQLCLCHKEPARGNQNTSIVGILRTMGAGSL